MAKKEQNAPSFTQEREAKRAAAMPEVKRLVKQYGRDTIAWCVKQLHEYEKKVEKAKELKKELRDLEAEIK